jgi:hypothetical protein
MILLENIFVSNIIRSTRIQLNIFLGVTGQKMVLGNMFLGHGRE